MICSEVVELVDHKNVIFSTFCLTHQNRRSKEKQQCTHTLTHPSLFITQSMVQSTAHCAYPFALSELYHTTSYGLNCSLSNGAIDSSKCFPSSFNVCNFGFPFNFVIESSCGEFFHSCVFLKYSESVLYASHSACYGEAR